MKAARRHGLMFGLSVPDPPEPDVLVADGELVPFGDLSFRVVHTPGHTPGSVTFIIENMAFVGDLIFQGSIGRTDFPGGSHEDLLESVRTRIFTLDDAMVLLPGHGPATTVGDEKRYNPFFTGG
jgi:hydroxyacylglutathione hydrolase